MATLISNSPEETAAIGEAWGREAESGWVFGLTGDLGAGKTQLVKGIARGLGSSARVHSPTFTLLNEYRGGRLPLYHIDLYRLGTREDVVAAGLEEYLMTPNGLTVVEWIERWEPSPTVLARINHRNVRMEVAGETQRVITYEDTRP